MAPLVEALIHLLELTGERRGSIGHRRQIGEKIVGIAGTADSHVRRLSSSVQRRGGLLDSRDDGELLGAALIVAELLLQPSSALFERLIGLAKHLVAPSQVGELGNTAAVGEQVPGRKAGDEREHSQRDEPCQDLPVADQEFAEARATVRHDDNGVAFEAHG